MRLLHTGDLHLDSPFCASDVIGADKKREMQRETFKRIIDLAAKEECRMILISGDLFDGKYVTPETRKCLVELFSSVDMPIVISPGNHDPYVNGSFYKSDALPSNVYVFSSDELQSFDFPELGVRVLGYAFTSSVMTENPLIRADVPENNGYIDVLCAHCDLSSPVSRYSPISPSDIVELGVQYAALGHIHKLEGDYSLGNTVIKYCGFAEGRSFDELGVGGAYVVDVDRELGASVRRVPVAAQRYEICELDVSAFADVSELRAELDKICNEYYRADMTTYLRVCLYGTAYDEMISNVSVLQGELSRNGLAVSIEASLVTEMDTDALMADVTLRGAFYKALLSGLSDADPKERSSSVMALRIGLAAIDGRRIPDEEDAR